MASVAHKTLEFEGFSLDLKRGCLRAADGEVALRPKSFQVLCYLVENAGRLVSKHELLAAVWPNVTVTEEALTHCVSDVRRGLADREQRIVRTIPRRGYLFAATVTQRESSLVSILPALAATTVASSLGSPSLAQGEHADLAGLDLTLPRQPSIAVLPFETLKAEKGGRIVADGLAQDIMTRLGRARWLFVIARGTAFTFRDRSSDPNQVARCLGVRYVLQGCIQAAGKRLRLNAALIDGVKGVEVWAQYFDRSLDDIFAVQDEITDVIVGRVHSEIQLAERQRALLTPMTDLDAWSAYHRGCWHMDRHTPGDYERAEEFFKAAGELDPRSARVFAALSSVHRQRAFLELSSDREGEIGQAAELAQHSLSLDPHDPQAHWAIGRALMLRREVEAALQEFETATMLNPSFAVGHYSVGFAQSAAGKNVVSDVSVTRAHRLSPYDPMRFAMLATRAINAAALGLHDHAADLARLAAAQPNAHHHIIATAALCHALAGRQDAAENYTRRLHALHPAYCSTNFFRAFPYEQGLQALLRKGFGLLGLP
jgi:TolB-like protein/DNA-binding winged helix-turn-helix (wHTH) protein/Tfp pilus assembly protein PilF